MLHIQRQGLEITPPRAGLSGPPCGKVGWRMRAQASTSHAQASLLPPRLWTPRRWQHLESYRGKAIGIWCKCPLGPPLPYCQPFLGPQLLARSPQPSLPGSSCGEWNETHEERCRKLLSCHTLPTVRFETIHGKSHLRPSDPCWRTHSFPSSEILLCWTPHWQKKPPAAVDSRPLLAPPPRRPATQWPHFSGCLSSFALLLQCWHWSPELCLPSFYLSALTML